MVKRDHYAAIRVYLLLLAVKEGDVELDDLLLAWAYKWVEDVKYSETVWLLARTDHESFMGEWQRGVLKCPTCSRS